MQEKRNGLAVSFLLFLYKEGRETSKKQGISHKSMDSSKWRKSLHGPEFFGTARPDYYQ